MKKILSFIFSTLFILPVFALPGFKPYLPDTAGDYVFYKDNSFNRESYVGILTYDESTYQIRYYAPADKEKQLVEKNIAILFNLNPEQNFLDMTGEKIMSQILPDTEDVDLVNYLHDLLYEFSSHRIKVDPVLPEDAEYKKNGSFWENGLSVKTEFPLFGGSVTMVYDALVPLFNIKSITDAQGNEVFALATFGTLVSSADFSFDNFKGIKKNVSENGNLFKLKKRAKKAEYEYEELKIILDENWTQSMDNLWFMGDAAMISAGSVPYYENPEIDYDMFLIRKLIMSSLESYVDASSLSITADKNGYKISSFMYQASDNNNVRNIKLLKRNSSKGFNVLIFTAYQKEYADKRKYFEDLVSKNNK